jgi:hypothetical protein
MSKFNDDIHTIWSVHTKFTSSTPPPVTPVSCPNNDRDGHGDASERDIRRHSLSYSSAFEEDPSESVHQLETEQLKRK